MKKLGNMRLVLGITLLIASVVCAQEEEVGQFDKRKDKNEKVLQEEKELRAKQFDEIVDQLEVNREEREALEKKLEESKVKKDEDEIKELTKKLEDNKEKGEEIEKKIMTLSE